jgi:hypothetical protein
MPANISRWFTISIRCGFSKQAHILGSRHALTFLDVDPVQQVPANDEERNDAQDGRPAAPEVRGSECEHQGA